MDRRSVPVGDLSKCSNARVSEKAAWLMCFITFETSFINMMGVGVRYINVDVTSVISKWAEKIGKERER
jgi:hypothetical protein